MKEENQVSYSSVCLHSQSLYYTNFDSFDHFGFVIGHSIVLCTMLDQRHKFHERGLLVELVGQVQAVSRAVCDGRFQLVFISPENLLRNLCFQEMLRTAVYQEHLVAFAVDEAHCVKK